MICKQCGRNFSEHAAMCPYCNIPLSAPKAKPVNTRKEPAIPEILLSLSQKVNTNGIIWLLVGILQIVIGIIPILMGNYALPYILIVGVLNIIVGCRDMRYSKVLLCYPGEILERFTPLAGPIITLVYNGIFGGVFGVAGSVYYLVAIRGYVMRNKEQFEKISL